MGQNAGDEFRCPHYADTKRKGGTGFDPGAPVGSNDSLGLSRHGLHHLEGPGIKPRFAGAAR
jgi:hypothetical protein